MGTKRKYDRASVVAEICKQLSVGTPLAVICRAAGMPDPSVVRDWQNQDESIARDIAHARDQGYDALAAECLSIADDRSDDPASRRVRTDVRLKLLAKWDPKRYGDKLEVGGSGKDGAILIQAITGVPSADPAD